MALTSASAYGLLLRESPELFSAWLSWLLMLLSTIGVAAGGYWLNDLYDRPIDRINRPHRAKWVAQVGGRALLTATLLLWGVSAALSLILPWRILLLHLLAIGSLAWYARWGKKTGIIGNALIAVLTGIVPWEVLLLLETTTYAADWMIPLAIGFNFVRELVKDAEDLEGDRLYGVQSLPSRLPPRAWHRLLRFLWLALGGLSIAPFVAKGLLWREWSWAYLGIAGVGIGLCLGWGWRQWGDYKLQSSLLKAAMGVGLLALWVL
jgi:4-hydroxybenzoate polyprenyltransferase